MRQPLPRPPIEWRAPILAALAILLALYSFTWAKAHPDYGWDGPILLTAAALLLGLALRRVPEPATATPTTVTPPSFLQSFNTLAWWRWLLVGTSGLLTIILLSRLAQPSLPSYTSEFLMWLAAMGAFAVAVAPPRTFPREDWGLWWAVHRIPALLVTLIIVAAFALRAYDIGNIPSTLGGDEGSQGLEAIKILNGEIRNPFTTGWLGVPTMSFFFNAPTIYFMGNTVTALRLPWALIGTATVLLMFWLVTRLHGLKMGLVTSALLAAYHYHIHFSRLGSNQIADPFFVALTMVFLYRGKGRDSVLDFVWAGVTVGVAQYFYAGARLTMILLFAVLIYFVWESRSRADTLRRALQLTAVATFAFLITAAPMLQYAVRFPNDYNARINEVGIFQNGWIEREQQNRGVGVTTLLLEQFQRAFLSFNYFPDRTVWYGNPKPLMDGIWAVLFMVGLLYASLRSLPPNAQRGYYPFVIWWWSGMVLGGILTENPPSTQRLVVLGPPAVFFVSLVLVRLVSFLQTLLARRERWFSPVLLTIFTIALSVISIRYYFADYTALNIYGSRNAEIATSMAYLMQAEMEDDQIPVFLGPPQMYIGFGTIPYLEPRAALGLDVHQPLLTPPTSESLGLAPGQRPFFFALPDRAGELNMLALAYPNGERRAIYDQKEQLLYWIYVP